MSGDSVSLLLKECTKISSIVRKALDPYTYYNIESSDAESWVDPNSWRFKCGESSCKITFWVAELPEYLKEHADDKEPSYLAAVELESSFASGKWKVTKNYSALCFDDLVDALNNEEKK